MCRFVAYLGAPILAEDLITKPDNSLIKQSYQAEDAEQTLNGDGFGFGWYMHEIKDEPALFHSITPAWNNSNLLHNVSVIRTRCMLAHVRAATEGQVETSNCHPFRYRHFLMMHNGGIQQFGKIKRDLINLLSEETFLWVKGQTDSEYIFALFMDHVFAKRKKLNSTRLPLEEIAGCFSDTFKQLEDLKNKRKIDHLGSIYNMVVTDGIRMVGTRYATQPDSYSRSLYYSDHGRYDCKDGVCTIHYDTGKKGSRLIVSEKLTHNGAIWKQVPHNHCVAIEEDLSTRLIPLD